MKIKSKKKFKNKVQHPYGGCIHEPNKDVCIKPEYIFKNRNNTWIDVGVCHMCGNQKECPNYINYKNKGK